LNGVVRRRDGRRNREALLEAAHRLFGTGPGVSMSDVAREAGLTRATAYRHFADKDALLDALVVDLAGDIVPDLVAQVVELDLGAAMDLVASTVVESVSAHRHVVTAIAPRLEQLVRQAVLDEPLEGFLTRRREAGELGVPEPDRWVARCVRALCLAAVEDTRPAEETRRDLAASLRRLVGLS